MYLDKKFVHIDYFSVHATGIVSLPAHSCSNTRDVNTILKLELAMKNNNDQDRSHAVSEKLILILNFQKLENASIGIGPNTGVSLVTQL